LKLEDQQQGDAAAVVSPALNGLEHIHRFADECVDGLREQLPEEDEPDQRHAGAEGGREAQRDLEPADRREQRRAAAMPTARRWS
jgi:hypothetical protein